jgi:hypothetical protein
MFATSDTHAYCCEVRGGVADPMFGLYDTHTIKSFGMSNGLD